MATHNARWTLAKIDPLFRDKIREVAIERLKRGVDKKISKDKQSIRRFTKAMTRYDPLWEILKEAKFKEDIE